MNYLLNSDLPAKAVFKWAVELFLLLTSAVTATLMAYQGSGGMPYETLVTLPFVLAIVNATVFYYFDLYAPQSYTLEGAGVVKLAKASFAASAILFVLFHVFTYHPASGASFLEKAGNCHACAALLANALLTPLVIGGWRVLFTKWLSAEFSARRVLIIGSGNLAKKIGQDLHKRRVEGFEVVGFIDDDPEKMGAPMVKPGVIGGYGDIIKVVQDHMVDEIIVALNDRRARLPMSALLECKLRGVAVVEGETFEERMTSKIPLDQLKPSWLVFSDGFKSLRSRKILKRMIDLVMSLLCFVVLSPVFMITAILIKLDSKGPIFYSQQRVGESGKEFRIYKFRSMYENAEDKTGPSWAKKDDKRVTRVGRIIRKLRIDEIPQLLNVIMGDMSFVGPRPEQPYFARQLKEIVPYYEIRSVVKPGITGWAQIKYSYGASVQDAMEKLQYDIYYIKNMSPLFDLLIILRTIKVVLKGTGAR